MKRLGCLAIGLLAMTLTMTLTGCANERYLDLGEKALDVIPEDIGRFSAHLGVRRAEEATKQKAIEAEKANEDADREFDKQVSIANPTTDVQAMAAANIEQSRTMRRIVRDLAKAIGGKNEFNLATTPTPKGAVSEGIDAIGNAAQKVGNTPAAVAGVVGGFIGSVAKAGIAGAGDKMQTGDNSPATLTKTTTTSKTEATNTAAEGSATGSAGNQQNTDILPAPPVEEAPVPVATVTE